MPTVQICFRYMDDAMVTLDLDVDSKIADVMERLEAAFLVLEGNRVPPTSTVGEAGLVAGSAVRVVRRANTGAVRTVAPPPLPQSTTTVAGPESAAPAPAPIVAPPAPAPLLRQPISYKLISGRTVTEECELDATVGETKARLQAALELSVPAQRWIFRGGVVFDDVTLRSLELAGETVIHVVHNLVDLSKVYLLPLRANCRYCEMAGAPYDVRALCDRCKKECVQITAGSRGDGAVGQRYEQLLDIRVACYMCDQDRMADGEDVNSIQERADIGFLCKSVNPGGFTCPTRKMYEPDPAFPRRRRMQYYVETAPGGVEVVNENNARLKRELQALFEYPAGAGLEDRR